MKEYLKETKLLNYSCDTISNLIDSKGWKNLDEFNLDTKENIITECFCDVINQIIRS